MSNLKKHLFYDLYRNKEGFSFVFRTQITTILPLINTKIAKSHTLVSFFGCKGCGVGCLRIDFYDLCQIHKENQGSVDFPVGG